MKRFAGILLSAALVLSLASCGGKSEETPAPPTQGETTAAQQVETSALAPEISAELQSKNDKTLVVYFSRVGNTDFPSDIDAVSSATLSRRDGELKGNAQLMAEWMADEADGDLFEIQTETSYPIDYTETTDVAKQEQNAGARPALKSHIEGFDSYSTVYLVFPNWWADLPMALYSFFDEYDFTGKTLYVSITHEGSSFSRTVSTIQSLEPDALVIEGLSIRGASVADSESTVRQFVQDNQ
ncbi:MAG: flavodoxin [Ruminococcaceae bacterium]|nr:flavodoxin [Oscillospiraceae bacterium]